MEGCLGCSVGTVDSVDPRILSLDGLAGDTQPPDTHSFSLFCSLIKYLQAHRSLSSVSLNFVHSLISHTTKIVPSHNGHALVH
jgi:hypothetical protein